MEYTFTVANFEEEVLNSPLPVLVDFYADWCNPCKMMAPTVAKLAEAYEGKVKVGKINVDENMTIAQKYRVASIPVSGCLCRIRVFDFLQIFSRNAVGICLDLLQSSHSNDPAAICYAADFAHL